MKKYLWAGLIGLMLLALPSPSYAGCLSGTICCQPVRVESCGNFSLHINGGPLPQCGPWYLYWPMEAHFAVPAPTGYPYWPAPMSLPTQAASYMAPPPAVQPACYQPGAYYPQGPSYWYGH